MSAPAPLFFAWDGIAMVPLNPRAADRQFVVGERYHLEHREERSSATHAHEFAWLHEAWANLPEKLADLYPTPEHLRKRALIEAGWYNERAIDVGSNAAALRVASFARETDNFALVIVRGGVVLVRTAKSQSRRAMNRREFAASKSAIMEVVASMIGVTPERLQQNTGKTPPAPEDEEDAFGLKPLPARGDDTTEIRSPAGASTPAGGASTTMTSNADTGKDEAIGLAARPTAAGDADQELGQSLGVAADERPSHAQSGNAGGPRAGGLARAAVLSPERRSEIASTAAAARWAR